MVKDPKDFTNLASNPEYAAEKLRLRKHLPKIDRAHAPGSAKRVLPYENGVANWEGEDIDPNEAIPD
jgi:hypothetical protein